MDFAAALSSLNSATDILKGLVAATLVGIKGCILYWSQFDGQSAPAWRNDVQLPTAVIEAASADELMPLAQAAWLAFGVPRPNGRGWGVLGGR